VVGSYVRSLGVEVVMVPAGADGRTDLDKLGAAMVADGEKVSAVAIQNPNFFGCVEDLETASPIVKSRGALFEVVINEPISLGLLHGPGHYGADVAVGEAHALGTPLQFGGPFLGFMAAREPLLRQMPGRLVGEAYDAQGRRGYVLTLSTREQHIRREKATSNICTNQGLIALAATIYMSLMGRHGLREVALQNRSKAVWAKERLSRVKGCRPRFTAPIFNEFVIELPGDPEAINRELLRRKIVGGLPLGRYFPGAAGMKNACLFCVTEMNTREEIESLAAGLEEALR
jgi:glycine dehydrogenase subunit 1